MEEEKDCNALKVSEIIEEEVNEIYDECYKKVKDLIDEAERRGVYLFLGDPPMENHVSKKYVKIVNGKWNHFRSQKS